METWKIGVIVALIAGLGGYGLLQQQQQTEASLPQKGKTALKEDNKAAGFIGQTLASEKIPEWSQVGPWTNTKSAITLNSLKGKPALVEFFRINCSHCQDAAPFMEALYKRYHPRGLQMIAVQSPGQYKDSQNEETMWPKVQSWIKQRGLTYPIAFDKNSQYFQKTIKGTFYPTMMITNPAGKVVYAQTGHDTEKAIQLAVELEKQFPSSTTRKANSQNLAKFMRPFIAGAEDPKLFQALQDDVEKRLEA